MPINEIGVGPEGVSVGLGSDNQGPGIHSQHRSHEVARQQIVPNILEQKRGWEAAGFHPLWAMGGGGSLGAPQAIGGQTSSPGITGHFSSKTIRPEEAASIRESNARRRLLDKQADEIQSRIDASNAVKTTNELAAAPRNQAGGTGLSFGGDTRFNTGISLGAQEAEDRWHELGGFGVGLMNIGADAVQNTLDADKSVQRTIDWYARAAREEAKPKFRDYDRKKYNYKGYRSKKKSYNKGPYRPKYWR